MQLGMIGLGRMGANMVRRLKDGGHDCVVYDVERRRRRPHSKAKASPEPTRSRTSSRSLEAPRSIWVMIPAAFVGDTLDELVPLLDEDDTIIDGGNSWYHLDVDRSKVLAAEGHPLRRRRDEWRDPRPGTRLLPDDRRRRHRRRSARADLRDARTRRRRRPSAHRAATGDIAPEEKGWLHCGPNGAGHFVKMVHNGIEYGLMSALGEGLNVLAKANIGKVEHDIDAETAPLDSAEYYQYDIDLAKVTEVWRRGSVITSWLLDLTAEAYLKDPAARRVQRPRQRLG